MLENWFDLQLFADEATDEMCIRDRDMEIIIHPKCVNFLTEISNYTWDTDKFGNKLNVPIDDFNHLMDSMRYGLEKYISDNKPKLNRNIIGGI